MRSFVFLVVSLLCAPAVAQDAAASESSSFGDRGMSVGGRVVGNFVQLGQPSDPAGEPTVLFGTAFTGYELKAGAAFSTQLMRVANGPLLLDVDLLVSHARASGFAESRTSPARRDLAISTTGVHLPAFASYGIEGKSTLLALGLGPELMFGFASGSKAEQTGVDGPAETLPTRSVIHVGIAAKLGMTFELAGGYLPIELRLTWDPFVPSSTRDRFDDFKDFDDTGQYGVAFNWHFGISVGYLVAFGNTEDETPTGTPVEAETPDEPESADEEQPEALF